MERFVKSLKKYYTIVSMGREKVRGGRDFQSPVALAVHHEPCWENK